MCVCVCVCGLDLLLSNCLAVGIHQQLRHICGEQDVEWREGAKEDQGHTILIDSAGKVPEQHEVSSWQLWLIENACLCQDQKELTVSWTARTAHALVH